MNIVSKTDKILFLNLDYKKSKASVKDTMAGLGEIYSNPKFKMPITDFIIGATIFFEKGYKISVVDNELEKMEHDKLIKFVEAGGYDIIFFRTSLPTFDSDINFIIRLKSANGNKQVKICLFAPFLDQVQDKIKKIGADYFIGGEAEFVFLDIANGLHTGNIKGLGRKENNSLVYSGEREHAGDLNLLPNPKWDLLDYKKYSFATCLTSRGCPYNCGYCPYPVYQGLKWRSKSVDLIIKELKDDYFAYKIEYLRFRDPEFTIDRDRVVEICKKIGESGIKIKWHAETRIDLLDRELLKEMKTAGCIELSFAVETINEETQKIINRKKISREKLDDILGYCNEIGIKTFGFFIIGLPQETEKTTKDLIKFSLDIDSYLNEFTIATPYPKTFLREWAEEKNLLILKDYSLYSGRGVAMKNIFMTDHQLKDLCRFANLANRIKLRNKQKTKFRIKTAIYQQLQNIEYFYLKNKIKFL